MKEKTAKGLLWGGFSNGLQQLLGVVFGIILAVAASGIIAYIATKRHYHSYRVARRKEIAAALREKESK